MSNEQPTPEEEVKVVAGDTAKSVGNLIASKLFEQHGRPADITMDQTGMAAVCALAAQTVLNAIQGQWQ